MLNQATYLLEHRLLGLFGNGLICDQEKKPIIKVSRNRKRWSYGGILFAWLIATLIVMGWGIATASAWLNILFVFVQLGTMGIIMLVWRLSRIIQFNTPENDSLGLTITRKVSKIPWRSIYLIAEHDHKLGSAEKKFWKSFFRSEWVVYDTAGNKYALILEEPRLPAILRRYIPFINLLLRTDYAIYRFGEREACAVYRRMGVNHPKHQLIILKTEVLKTADDKKDGMALQYNALILALAIIIEAYEKP